MARRRPPSRFSAAMAASAGLHALAVLAVLYSPDAAPPPTERVYAVDIVSPPPNVAGERPTEAPAAQAPAEAEPEPEPEPEPPEPEPAPPEPDPEPSPPREQPTPPRERPKAETPPQRPPRTPTTGSGAREQPAAGQNPRPESPGGEGVRVHSPGDPCPVAGYCENVTMTVQRYFRPPAGSAGARGEVCFRILRDGGVAGMRVARMSGGTPAFRLAMMEAAEAAGQRRAFGALPAAFDPDRWTWCVELSPS